MRKRRLRLSRETIRLLDSMQGVRGGTETNYCPYSETCRICPAPTTFVPSVDGCGSGLGCASGDMGCQSGNCNMGTWPC